MFHGASQPEGFIFDGFDLKRLGGLGLWYGRGCYTTSCLDYALCDQYQRYAYTREEVLGPIAATIRGRGGKFKMLLLVCNLGNCRIINQFYGDQDLPSDVDSHFVRVQKGRPVQAVPTPGIPIYDEYVFKNKYAVAPQFIVTFRIRPPEPLLVWRNTAFRQYGSNAIVDSMIRQFSELRMVIYDCDEDALCRIEKTMDKSKVFVVTNRADGGDTFLAKCRAAGVTTPMLVFCSYAENWTPMSGVTISSWGNAVPKFIQDVVLKS
jgi:hypothetical protein